MRGDGREADRREPVRRDAEDDAARDVRGAGLELPGQLVVRRLLERDGRDHVAAALVRRELLEPRLRAVERADAGRAVHLVARHRVEVAAERRDVDREVRRGLRAVHEDGHVARLREADELLDGIDRAERVRDVRRRPRSSSRPDRRFSNSSTGTSPESVIGDDDELRARAPARELPRDDVRVVLETREEDLVALLQDRGCAKPAATRLIASVVPRVKTTSFGARAPRKRATFARAPSYSAVAFSERKCVPRWMFAFVSS